MPATSRLRRRAGARRSPGVRQTLLAAVLALPLGVLAPAPAQAAEPAARAASLDVRLPGGSLVQRSLEDRVITLTNAERRANGCRDLRPSSKLRVSARRHTVAMAAADEMSHQLPGEAYFAQRITKAGYRGWRLVAENVAHGFTGPEAVMAAWMASPGHRRNILNCKLRDIGVGVVLQDGELWWTQNFGRR